MNNRVSVVLAGLACLGGASGCAPFISSVSDRAIMSDHFDKAEDGNKLKSMSGDRRQIRVVQLEDGGDAGHNFYVPKDKRYVVCPEPFAGAIIARGTTGGVKIIDKAEGTDATTQSALLVDARTDVIRWYQDATHRWCMMRAEGDVSGPEYVEHMRTLDEYAYDALTSKARTAAEAKAAADKKAADEKKAADARAATGGAAAH